MLQTKFQGHQSIGSGEDFLRFLPYMCMGAMLVKGHEHCSHRCCERSYEMLQNRIWYHKIAECIAKYK